MDLDLEWETLSPVQENKDPVNLDQEESMEELLRALHYLKLFQCTGAKIYANQVTPKDNEYHKYQSFLGLKPVEVIKRTFEATTQFAAVCFSPPICRHYKSQFPTCNKPRLREMFCTNAWFGSSPAIGGYTCA